MPEPWKANKNGVNGALSTPVKAGELIVGESPI